KLVGRILGQLRAKGVNHALAKRGPNQGAKLLPVNLPVIPQQPEATGIASGATQALANVADSLLRQIGVTLHGVAPWKRRLSLSLFNHTLLLLYVPLGKLDNLSRRRVRRWDCRATAQLRRAGFAPDREELTGQHVGNGRQRSTSAAPRAGSVGPI